MTKLLIASTNRGKLREFQEILSGEPYDLFLPADLGIALTVEETGTTYRENAALKARAYAQASGLITLSDDSGLEVQALGGAPGLHSARYAPQTGATDADRRAYLLENLRGKPRPWLARFVCTVAIATPQGEIFFTEGECPGEIIPEERGTHGFGYDPIFYFPERGMTMAELPPEEKNRISHRARAVMAAVPILRQLLAKG
ncbi:MULTISPECIES: RdgB/HAM1 family non-canonical purine NTP pyrophosphatase [Anaerolinea]|uniref:RdgB/HAM1 family non-canonical purine NTP pyrophosphatase n=1 Tax=Anaerolinea TaxID=233189 RepID=UPI00262AAAE4|nr:RdgB/HAM1 family non-canonical purine NTP pyrophosphatase [Anaerolinea thermophila]